MVIIAYEGKTDEEFLNSLLKHYNLPRKNVYYYNFEGKDKILNLSDRYYNEIEILQDKIEKMLIIVDADNKKDPNPNRGFDASQKALVKLKEDLDFSFKIDYHIMCDENNEGHLESFLLSVLDTEQKECFNKFKKCYKYELSDKLVYNTFYKQMNHPCDFSHRNFDALKQKLINLFEESK